MKSRAVKSSSSCLSFYHLSPAYQVSTASWKKQQFSPVFWHFVWQCVRVRGSAVPPSLLSVCNNLLYINTSSTAAGHCGNAQISPLHFLISLVVCFYLHLLLPTSAAVTPHSDQLFCVWTDCFAHSLFQNIIHCDYNAKWTGTGSLPSHLTLEECKQMAL